MPPDRLCLMAIFAHPDDESFGAGSTLARYAAEGIHIHLITATRGQVGWQGEPAENPGPQALGDLREAELQAAAQVLGIHEVTVLDYVDGELDSVPAPEIVGRLAREIRTARPQVIVTFGGDGGYGHVDHIAISQFATAAVVTAAAGAGGAPGHCVSKLYYMLLDERVQNDYSEHFGDFAMEFDGVERRPVIWPEWAVTTRIDAGEHWRTAWKAAQCHASQLPNLEDLRKLSDDELRDLWGPRPYYRAMSLVNSGREVEDDLFAGLRGLGPAYLQ